MEYDRYACSVPPRTAIYPLSLHDALPIYGVGRSPTDRHVRQDRNVAEAVTRLKPKQEAFVSAYIGEAKFNATKAALMAGYTGKNPRAEGSRLLANPDIAACVREALTEMALPAEAVLSELADVASADWREFVTIRTNPRTGEVIEVKMDLSNKVKALELLGKHHQLFTDKLNIGGDFLDVLKAFGRGDSDD